MRIFRLLWVLGETPMPIAPRWRPKLLRVGRVALTIGVSLMAAPELSGSDQLQQKFEAESIGSWKAYRTWANNLQGTVMVILTKGSTTLNHDRFEYHHNANCSLVLQQSLLKPQAKERAGIGQIRAFNALYALTLERKSTDRPWVLTGLERRQEGNTGQIVKDTKKGASALATLLITWPDDLEELVQQPTFRVLSVSYVQYSGVEMARVDFENAHAIMPERGKPFVPVQSGTLLLDPNRSWCLRSAEFKCKYSDSVSTVRVETEVSDSQGKFPIPKRRQTTIDIDNLENHGHHVEKIVSDFVLSSPSQLPSDADFMLSAFGLPEPYGATQIHEARGQWFLWAAMGGAACIVIGVIIRWRQRKLS
jgi:hypothetical protein